ncbi:histidinol-phosphatase [Candidatus Amarobacter glycogenicus]|uniref:histidinol-phosphatase n=1 Tax=Candidatus Amarobacter glycogenicus TaxID=3140699 RepID=UPI0031CCC0CF
MHTPLCKHASGQPEEYAAAAARRRLAGIVITCHNPGPSPDWSPQVRMSINQFDEYVDMVARAREAWHGRVDVRLGLECDYLPGMETWIESLLNRAPYHHVLRFHQPQLDYYRDAYDHGDPVAFQQTYFDHLAQSAESGLFDTIAHPDLVKNVFRTPGAWIGCWTMCGGSLDCISRTGVAMELNTSGLHKRIREMNPNSTILAEMRLRDIPVVIGSMLTTWPRGRDFCRGWIAARCWLRANQLLPRPSTSRREPGNRSAPA